MRVVNYIFRLGDNTHKYAYDEETLTLTLKTAGFDIKRRGFDPNWMMKGGAGTRST